MQHASPLVSWGMIKGRFGQLCADGAAFFVKFGSVNNEDLTPSSVLNMTPSSVHKPDVPS